MHFNFLADSRLPNGQEFFEGHRHLLTGLGGHPIRRPNRIPFGFNLNVDIAECVTQPLGDLHLHGVHKGTPTGRQDELDGDLSGFVDEDLVGDAHVDNADAAIGTARVIDSP